MLEDLQAIGPPLANSSIFKPKIGNVLRASKPLCHAVGWVKINRFAAEGLW